VGLKYLGRVTHLNLATSFGFRDIGDDHQAEIVVEAVTLEPVRTCRSTFPYESFPKAIVLAAGIWVASGYNTALAGLDTVQSDIADSERDRFSVVSVETVLPERRYTIDLYIRPEPTTDAVGVDLIGFEP